MKTNIAKLNASLLAAGATALGLLAPQALAQTNTVSASGSNEEVIVTGTRVAQRTMFESTAPVDVVSSTALQAAVSDELVDKLAETIPSFVVQRLPMADGQIYVRPAMLRNLSPDQTLVLINGKRRHRSSLLGSNGAQGVDMATIPSFAVGRIEVLRDGASAQYGSDAIAGVVNVILDEAPGYRGYGEISQYYEGDGLQYQAGAKAGFGLGARGFILGSLQWSNSNATSRSIQRADAIAYQAAHPEVTIADPVQHWGQPDLKSWRAAVNSKFELTNSAVVYAFGTANWANGMSDFNWRNPAGTSAYGSSTVDPAYDLLAIYPAGFTPRFGQHDRDYSAVAGVKGGGELAWDASISWGRNEIAYYSSNTINASFGSLSPTAFYLGTLSQEEFNQNLDFVYALETGWFAGPANIAFGAEHRQETYGVDAGEPMSWQAGPAAVDGLPSGANGFPGYSDDQAGRWSMQSWAGYVDVEVPITPSWTVSGAGRYESYSDFGGTLNGKVSTRYEIVDGLALRGSYSTGFRAPTPGQVNSTRTSQGLDTVTLNLFTAGRLSPNNPVSQYFGAQPLKPEKSHNASLGAAFAFGSFTGSIDAYQINISDRFGTSPNFAITDAIRTQLLAMNVPGADSITTVNFYTNAYSTRTQGVDIVGGYATEVGGGLLNLSAAANFNYTSVTRTDGTFSESTIVRMEKQRPNIAANASVEYKFDRYQLQGKVRFYGPWTDITGNTTTDLYQRFGSMALFDVAVRMDVTENIQAIVGAENLFNSYPDQAIYQASRGLKYSRNAPYDTDGGQYYFRVNVKY